MESVSIEEDLWRIEAKMQLIFKIRWNLGDIYWGKCSLGNLTQDIVNKVDQKDSSRNIPRDFVQMELRTWTRIDRRGINFPKRNKYKKFSEKEYKEH